jgi:uncharacterized protein (TIGR03790 family)
MWHGRFRSWLGTRILWAASAMAFNVWAGGSGLNTVVIANQVSSNSLELANYYCVRRAVPPENVLRISWPGTNTLWTSNEFQINLLTPLLNMLAARQLTNQVHYVVLSMDIPFQTSKDSTVNGTTSALFYGLKPDALGTKGVVNSYAASEQVFAQAKPWTAPGYSFLTTMITGDSLAQAKQLVDQGVASDGTFPVQPVILAKSSDPVRNVRYSAFDNAIFNTQICGRSSVLRTNSDSPWGQTNLLGYETGLANFSVSPGTFVPGAMADSLSSFGGVIFGPNGQTSLLAFINAGAAGSYGTVTEPTQDLSKFPDPQVYFYQSRGFGLAECYYQGLQVPYMGLIVGEPLAAPFAQPGSGSWLGTNTISSGLAPLSLQFSAPDALAFQQIDLFVDGKYFQTLTNVTPRAGNVLNLALNGYPVSYTVPTNASLGLVTSGLAAVLNAPAVTSATKIVAYPHGDRIELHSLATNRWAEPFYFNHTSGNSSNCSYRATYLPDTFPPQLTPGGLDRNGAFRLHVDIASTLPYVIEASTNLTEWLPVFTNLAGGLLDFVDADTARHPRRFYRVVESVPDPRPRLSVAGATNGGGIVLHIETAASLPYAIQVSTNSGDWTPLCTNQVGGAMDFVDLFTTNATPRFYRTWNIPAAPPTIAVLDSPAGNALVRVDNAVRPFVVEASTNQEPWVGVVTNYVLGEVQTAVSSSPGSAAALTTFLVASRSTFLSSAAFGLRSFEVSGSPQIDAWLQLSVTKTNGTSVSVAVTNPSGTATPLDLAGQLSALISTTSALQGSDGVVLEDLTSRVGVALFNLRARSAGYEAAAVRVRLAGSANLSITPSAQSALTNNLGDLQPRNHLYVTAGASRLGLDFTLDTSTLADGHHELTAVAYEGSHVRTQTRATLPVMIQNGSLSAIITLLDLFDTAPVQGSYHIQVAANTTNDISTIALYSTGGVLETVTNQSTAIFQVDGGRLGVGRHPFYALVRDVSGLSYRTETKWVRLISGP